MRLNSISHSLSKRQMMLNSACTTLSLVRKITLSISTLINLMLLRYSSKLNRLKLLKSPSQNSIDFLTLLRSAKIQNAKILALQGYMSVSQRCLLGILVLLLSTRTFRATLSSQQLVLPVDKLLSAMILVTSTHLRHLDVHQVGINTCSLSLSLMRNKESHFIE